MAKDKYRQRYIPTELGFKIKEHLLRKGLRQKWLADELGISLTYLGDIIYGRRSAGKYEEPIKKFLKS